MAVEIFTGSPYFIFIVWLLTLQYTGKTVLVQPLTIAVQSTHEDDLVDLDVGKVYVDHVQ